VPATIAVLDGVARIGLDAPGLARVAEDPALRKLSARDLSPAAAQRASGATTVSATMVLAAAAGVRVFATGGLGGVHRGGAYDESADLVALSRVPMGVVCAGVKSILDVAATLERLETLGVTVLGYRSDEFPGFYLHSSGHRVSWRAETPGEVAEVLLARDALQASTAVVIANPVPLERQLDPDLHDRVLAGALASAEAAGIEGQAITPYLLERMVVGTAGASLEANLAAVRANCALAAEVAVALADRAACGG
jgi:pseudouridine-5'-phosphate glycosidase